MSWFVFSFISAIFTSFAAVLEKKVLFKSHAMEFASVLAVINAVLVLPLFLFIDYANLELAPVLILFFISVIGAVAFLLMIKAIRHKEISEVAPLRIISPGLTAFLAFLFLHENLEKMDVFGIMFLVVGLFVLETRSWEGVSFWEYFKPSRYTLFIFGAIFLYSITALLDRYILSRYNFEPIAYIAFVHLFLAIHFLILHSTFHDGFHGLRRGISTLGGWILLVALFTVIYRLAQIQAISMTSVGLAVAIRDISPLFTIIIGGELFHEKNLLRKVIASFIMAGGVALIVV